MCNEKKRATFVPVFCCSLKEEKNCFYGLVDSECHTKPQVDVNTLYLHIVSHIEGCLHCFQFLDALMALDPLMTNAHT